MSWDAMDRTSPDAAPPPPPPRPEPDLGPPRGTVPPPTQPAPKKGGGLGRGCLIAVLTLFGVIGLGIVCTILIVFLGIVGAAGSIGGLAASGEVVDGITISERTVSGTAAPGAAKVVLIPVNGVLMRDGAKDPVRLLQAMLKRAAKDDAAAVILTIDSGGGGVTASDVMHKAILDFKRTGAPVVVLMEDVAASGAYYISCPANSIVAHPTTLTGSIGVMWPMFSASRLMGMIGVEDRSVTSGEFKDMGSPFAEKTEEQWRRDREVIQGIIDSVHARFVDVVAEGRHMEREKVEALADGRIFTGKEALDMGLVDAIGYLEDAIEEAKSLGGFSDPVHVVAYEQVVSVMDILTSKAQQPGVSVEVGGSLESRLRQRPMYLWNPRIPPSP